MSFRLHLEALVWPEMALIQLQRGSGLLGCATHIRAKAVDADKCTLTANALRHCPTLILTTVALIDVHGVTVFDDGPRLASMQKRSPRTSLWMVKWLPPIANAEAAAQAVRAISNARIIRIGTPRF